MSRGPQKRYFKVVTTINNNFCSPMVGQPFVTTYKQGEYVAANERLWKLGYGLTLFSEESAARSYVKEIGATSDSNVFIFECAAKEAGVCGKLPLSSRVLYSERDLQMLEKGVISQEYYRQQPWGEHVVHAREVKLITQVK